MPLPDPRYYTKRLRVLLAEASTEIAVLKEDGWTVNVEFNTTQPRPLKCRVYRTEEL